MNNFDSILERARKLAALAADPAATDGERDNALRMLKAHCDRHKITPERLAVENRRHRILACIVPGKFYKPVRSMDLVRLAKQCLLFVVGEDREFKFSKDEEWRTIRKKRGLPEEKAFRIFVAHTSVTDLEYEEWKACFHHYAADFWDSFEALKRKARVAAKAAKMALSGFVNKHGIFPPNAPVDDGKTSLENMEALLQAMKEARGEGFQRGMAKLHDGGLLL